MKIKRLKSWDFFSKLAGLVLSNILPTVKQNLLYDKQIAQKQLVDVTTGIIKNYEWVI